MPEITDSTGSSISGPMTRQNGHTQFHIALAQSSKHQIPVGAGRYQQHQQADADVQRVSKENLAQKIAQ